VQFHRLKHNNHPKYPLKQKKLSQRLGLLVANNTHKNASESQYRAVVFMVLKITALKMDRGDMGHKINKLDQARKK